MQSHKSLSEFCHRKFIVPVWFDIDGLCNSLCCLPTRKGGVCCKRSVLRHSANCTWQNKETSSTLYMYLTSCASYNFLYSADILLSRKKRNLLKSVTLTQEPELFSITIETSNGHLKCFYLCLQGDPSFVDCEYSCLQNCVASLTGRPTSFRNNVYAI